MMKQTVTLMLALLLLNLHMSVVAARTIDEDSKFAAKVKTEVAQLGSGTAARVEVELRDRTKLKGYILQSDANEFVLVNARDGKVVGVSYPQVRTVKGNNLATGVKVAIGIGLAVLALAVFCKLYKPCESS
jgi:hypothetical protein